MFDFLFKKEIQAPTILMIGKVENFTAQEKKSLLSNQEARELLIKYADIQIAYLGNALADPVLSVENLRLLQGETRAMLKLKNFFGQIIEKD